MIEDICSFYLNLAEIKHPLVRKHCINVGRMARNVASVMNMDDKAAYYAGTLHDIGKICMPYTLFDDHDITGEEYEQVKLHALYSYKVLRDEYLFTSLVAGMHHAMKHNGGYGLSVKDFPETISAETVLKVLRISTLVSICDFTDAYCCRQTTIKGEEKKSLREMLLISYPNETEMIDCVLKYIERGFYLEEI